MKFAQGLLTVEEVGVGAVVVEVGFVAFVVVVVVVVEASAVMGHATSSTAAALDAKLMNIF